jgi:gamma-glutamylcyclotransferase (GGCT)/AIG2-like uncharacterized protein YtfP
MRLRCPRARFVSTARLEDHRLAFAGWSTRWKGGVATVVPAEGANVPGALYRLDAADLAALDRFEGCPIVYMRRAAVVVAAGRQRRAQLYILQAALPTPPAAGYFAVLLGAYRAWGFDRRPLVDASLAHTTR